MPECTQITLRALEGTPLANERTRDMVIASATSLAERHGMHVAELRATDAAITITLHTGRIQAIGFAAELRRVTETWFTRKYGVATLWGEVTPGAGGDDDDAADAWKRA